MMSKENIIYFAGFGTWCIDHGEQFAEDEPPYSEVIRCHESGLFRLPSHVDKALHYSGKCSVSTLYPCDYQDGVDETSFDFFLLDTPETFKRSEIVTPSKLKSKNTTNFHTQKASREHQEVIHYAKEVLKKYRDSVIAQSSGRPIAAKIVKMFFIDRELCWPDLSEPPLSTDKMERIVSNWINEKKTVEK